MAKLALGFLAFLLISGCSSADKNDNGRGVIDGSYGQEDYDQENTAHGAAYRVDALHIRKPMPSRSNWKPLNFYFKHCSQIGEKHYYSKTSYECSGPF